MERTSFVYFVKFENTKGIKIGKADDLYTRLSTLVKHYGKIKHALFQPIAKSMVLSVEKSYHKKFRTAKLNIDNKIDGSNEFFDIKFSDLDNHLLELGNTLKTRINKNVVNGDEYFKYSKTQNPDDLYRLRLNLTYSQVEDVRTLLGITTSDSLEQAIIEYLLKEIKENPEKMSNNMTIDVRNQELQKEKQLAKQREYTAYKRRLEAENELYQYKQEIDAEIERRLGTDYENALRTIKELEREQSNHKLRTSYLEKESSERLLQLKENHKLLRKLNSRLKMNSKSKNQYDEETMTIIQQVFQKSNKYMQDYLEPIKTS